ncbi:MAG: hypothetical protein ACRELV_07800, partial [Longimicrobiales bacterium]
NFLRRLRAAAGPGVGETSAARLDRLLAEVRALSADAILEAGIHEELTLIVDRTADIAAGVETDFFVPALARAAAAREA